MPSSAAVACREAICTRILRDQMTSGFPRRPDVSSARGAFRRGPAAGTRSKKKRNGRCPSMRARRAFPVLQDLPPAQPGLVRIRGAHDVPARIARTRQCRRWWFVLLTQPTSRAPHYWAGNPRSASLSLALVGAENRTCRLRTGPALQRNAVEAAPVVPRMRMQRAPVRLPCLSQSACVPGRMTFTVHCGVVLPALSGHPTARPTGASA